MSIGNSDNVLHALEDYSAELGVLGNVVLSDRFMVLRQSRHPIILMVPRGHQWAGRGSIDVKELNNAAMVMREPGSSTRRLFERGLADHGVRPHVTLELGSREAVREAVAAGLGIGAVQAAEFGGDDRLASVSVTGVDLIADEFVICLKERSETPLLRQLIAKLSGQFALDAEPVTTPV